MGGYQPIGFQVGELRNCPYGGLFVVSGIECSEPMLPSRPYKSVLIDRTCADLPNRPVGDPQCKVGTREPLVYLIAAVLGAKAPFAEVLAVVGQQAIASLPYARTRAPHDFIGIESGRAPVANPKRATVGELLEADLFDRPSAQALHETAVLNDLSAPNIDAVMGITSARRNEVCTWIKGPFGSDRPIGSGMCGRSVGRFAHGVVLDGCMKDESLGATQPPCSG
jgi:hypothetical protein